MNTCLNCANIFEGTYCTECGQKINSGRIYLKELADDFFTNFFTIDSPPFRTIKALTTKPGNLIREFISGKRKRYYKPVQYFILILAFHLLARALLNFNPVENQFRAMGKSASPPEVMNTVQMQASYFMAKNINLLLFVFVFIFAAFTRLFFRKSGYNYTEHLASGFYSIGHYVLLSTFVIPLSFIDPKLYYLVYLLIIGYLTFTLVSFHKPKLLTGILKSLAAIIISFILYVMVVYISSIYYIIIFLK